MGRIALVLALLGALALGPARTPAAAPAPRDLFSIRLDGGGRVQLTRTPLDEASVDVSADGKWIAFTRRRADPSEADVWTRRLASGAEHEIGGGTAADGRFRGPVWSPRGLRIAFTWFDVSFCTHGALKCARPQVRLSDGPTGPVRAVRQGAVNPAWSPDGRRLAAMGGWATGEPFEIETFRPSGVGARSVAGPGWDPSWSADGRHIAYERSDVEGDGRIAVVPARGGRPSTVARGTRPQWAPRGRRLLYESAAGRIVRADPGKRPLVLTRGSHAAWSPDGRRVAFVRNNGLWVIAADGRGERLVTPAARLLDRPAWSPDGRRLYYAAAS